MNNLCKVTFFQKQFRQTFWIPFGQTLLEVAKLKKVELEGACDGTLACSTCHLVLDKKTYNKLSEPSEDEVDMLDLAHGLKDTSRLGCQIKTSKITNGIICEIPQ